MKIIFFETSHSNQYAFSKNGVVAHESESCSFTELNGKYYILFEDLCDLKLEHHFKEARSEDGCINGVLAVWITSSYSNGIVVSWWFNNAIVYRKNQFILSEKDKEKYICFRIEVDKFNSHILPEKERKLPIEIFMMASEGDRAHTSNAYYVDSIYAKTIIEPRVVEYLNNHNEVSNEFIFTHKELRILEEEINVDGYFEKILRECRKCIDASDIKMAMNFYNVAMLIKDTLDLMYKVGDILLQMFSNEEAVKMLQNTLKAEDEKLYILEKVIYAYKDTLNRDKVTDNCIRMLYLVEDLEKRIFEEHYNDYLSYRNDITHGKSEDAEKYIDEFSEYDDAYGMYFLKEMQSFLIKEKEPVLF